MKVNLTRTINHIKDTSLPIDQLNTIIKKSWVLANSDRKNELEKWIFLNHQNLLISINGNLTSTKWKFVSELKEFIIGGQPKGKLLELIFFNNNLLIFKIPLVESKYKVFVNSKRSSPSLGISLLTKMRHEKHQVQVIPIKSKEKNAHLEVYNAKGIRITSEKLFKKYVFQNAWSVKNNYYWHKSKNIQYEIQNGQIVSIKFAQNKKRKDGAIITFISKKIKSISIGDRVYFNKKIYEENQITLTNGYILLLKNGKVVKKLSPNTQKIKAWSKQLFKKQAL